MLTPDQQIAISAAARSLKDIKWHGQGRSYLGVDCCGVVIFSFSLIGIQIEEGKPDYQTVETERMIRLLRLNFDALPRSATLVAGDVVVYGLPREAHLGLIVDGQPVNMIQCPMFGRVVEARFDPTRGIIRGFYRWRS